MTSQIPSIVSEYLGKLRQECGEKKWDNMQERKPAVAEALQAEPAEVQIAFVTTAMANLGDLTPAFPATDETLVGKVLSGVFGSRPIPRLKWTEFRMLGHVVSGILRRKLPFQSADLAEMVRSYSRNAGNIHYWFPLGSLLVAVEKGERTPAIEAAMRELRKSYGEARRLSNTKEIRKLLERIDQYLEPRQEQCLTADGPWSSTVLAEINELAEPERGRWSELLSHCVKTQSSVPSRAWRTRSEELIATLGKNDVKNTALRWLNRDTVPATVNSGCISDKDADYLKGFVWLLAGFSDAEICRAIADFGLACLRKIPSIGPVSARVGFACVNTVAAMPGMEPVAQLTRMRVKVKYAVALKLIEKALNAAAEKSGLSRDDLEDMAVPNFGLDASGTRSERLGDCSVDLVLAAGSVEVELRWKNNQGKVVKSPPAEIRTQHATELKAIKRTAADMQKMASAQRLRIEQFLINERKMAYEHWREYFLDPAFMGAVARRLIWRFERESGSTLGAWWNGEIVDWNNEALAGLEKSTLVQLWHPLQSDTQTIFSWRCWLEDHRIVQPFKQAHREVYILTPAEEQTDTYSNRFAGHVIRQHQFASLCRERGWTYRLMGDGFDGGNAPTRELSQWSMKVEFWVDLPSADTRLDPRAPSDQISGSGINLYLLTDQVRFYREGVQVRLADVPPIVLSEVMRDVDLFVGVTSIGNDPTWADHGNDRFGQYWQGFAFGELGPSGETRREILERLLPQLKIASRCRLDGKFLVVRGELHTYKIHLGSANVLVEPGSHYLCIVPDRSIDARQKGVLYLPFEGDQTLAIILSKALLLAADNKITDATILRQIGPLHG